MKFTKRAALLFVTMSIGLVANAENWYMVTNCSGKTLRPFTTDASSYWTNSLGQAANTIASNDECFIVNTYQRYDTDKFPGAKLHLAMLNGSLGSTIQFRDKPLTDDLYWHRGKLSTNCSKVDAGYCGFADGCNIYLDLAKQLHAINCGSSECAFNIPALHCSESDLNLEITSVSGKSNFVFYVKGDNANYKGKMSCQVGYANRNEAIVAGNANALGDPTTERADALTIDTASSVFSVISGVTLNSARGITINTNDFQVFAGTIMSTTKSTYYSFDCSSFALNMPIAGTYGFNKTGSGTVTLGGAYTAGAITVEAGMLIIAATATFPAGQEIVVKSGATLETHQSLANFSITREDGATVRRICEVAYDSSTQTVTPFICNDFTADGVSWAFRLSEAIPVPSHTNLEWEVITVPSGLAEVSATTFEDITEKTFGLPRTSLRVEADGDGTQHVYYKARPVVTSIAEIASGIGMNGTTGATNTWSDLKMPHTGADYLFTNTVKGLDQKVFGGDTLTFSSASTIMLRYIGYSVVNLLSSASGEPPVIWPGATIMPNYSGRDLVVTGSAKLPGNYGDTNYVYFSNHYGDTADHQGTIELAAALTGAGSLRIIGAKNGTTRSGISGNNTNYFGRIVITGNGTTREACCFRVRVSKAESLGGCLDSSKYNALTLTEYAMLNATESFTLVNDKNRGLYISGNGGFDCDSGKVLTYYWPLRLNSTMYKLGQGTLRLGGKLSRTKAAYTNMIVRAGTVEPLSDAAIAGMAITATNDFTVSLSTPLSTGFAGFNLKNDAKVHILFDRLAAGKPSLFESAICTVGGDGSAVESNIVIDRVPSYVCQLVKTPLSGNKTRLSIKCERRGLCFLVQ